MTRSAQCRLRQTNMENELCLAYAKVLPELRHAKEFFVKLAATSVASRALWITRITAACKMRGTRYSLFMNGLKMSGNNLNRKMLSQIAIDDPKLFDRLVEQAVSASTAVPAAKAG